MNKTLTVAVREFVTHLQKPSFYLATIGIPLFIALIMFLSNQGRTNDALGQQGLGGIGQLLTAQGVQPFGYTDGSGTITTIPAVLPPGFVKAYPDEAAGRAALTAGTISAFYVIPADYRASGRIVHYTRGVEPGNGVTSQQVLRLVLLANLLPDHDPRTALRLEEPMQLQAVAVAASSGSGAGDLGGQNLLLVTGFALLLTYAIFMSSGILLQALLEEKENRVMEVLLTSGSARQLLTGKVLGLGALGLIQLLIWLGLAYALTGSGASFMAALGTVTVPLAVWGLAVVYFLLGYLFFAALMAGVGAISPSRRESSQYAGVVTMLALVPLFLLGPLAADPNGALAVFLSVFPPTAPAIMLARLAVTAVPLWQVAVSLAVLALTVVGGIAAAARLFRAGTLLQGTRLSWREVRRALAG
ncbi:MAG TPA: ABC transporter permease [Chloroflexia bacterium]|jgi:ABC-2 type transport system permease protein|nr:ABC transporter permease [Chloroflexia bacterium]